MRINPSPKRRLLDAKWLDGKISDADYVAKSKELDDREAKAVLGHVSIDEREAMRIAAACKPEDIENGNLEEMIFLALRLAHWRGHRAGKALGQTEKNPEADADRPLQAQA